MDAAGREYERETASERAALTGDEAGSRRADTLAEIRAMIDDGSYITAERLDAAVSRLLDTIGDPP